MHTSVHMVDKRASVVSQAVKTVSTQRGQNLTICFGHKPQLGLIHYMLLICGLTKEKFSSILSVIDVSVKQPFFLLCGNTSYHDPQEMHGEHHQLVFYLVFAIALFNAAEYAGYCL